VKAETKSGEVRGGVVGAISFFVTPFYKKKKTPDNHPQEMNRSAKRCI
jgi:hypothetical protein